MDGMANLKRILRLIILASVLAGCGTLQVGIEATTTSVSHPTVSTTSTISATNTVVETPTGVVPTVTLVAPTSVPTISVRASPTAAPERINFPVGGTNFSFPTKLTRGVPERYILQVIAQQKMTITTSRNVTVSVLDVHGAPVRATSDQPGQWQGTIPQSADYVIVLKGEGFINVSIDIPPPG